MVMPAAYPFVEVYIDTSGLQPTAQRSPGVIAIVGTTPAGAAGGTAAANRPYLVNTLDDVNSLFAQTVSGKLNATPLSSSLTLAMLQNPKPSRIYGVRADGNNYAAALSSLEAQDDVTFVALANVTAVGTADPPTGLMALKAHVENMSASGLKRIGVAMVDPAVAKTPTYAADTLTAVNDLKSTVSRMIMIAARGATGDVASAAMAAIAGYPPHISMVLKKIVGVTMPVELQYSPSEIIQLSEGNIIPIIDPALIVGESLHFAEGRLFTTDASLLHIDTARVMDHTDFQLKAGLINSVGNLRITKFGMTALKGRIEGILGPLKREQVIVDFTVAIPVLSILQLPEASWTDTDQTIVTTARSTRLVDVFVTVVYGPAVHRLKVSLALTF
jgi:hypothetical protein